MKKKVLALVICALGISTIGAFAQSENKENCEVKTEQCCKEKKGKKRDKGDFKGDRKKGDRKKGNHAKMNPFNGIQLTPEQQQKVNELRAQQKSERQAEKQVAKESKMKAREKFNSEVAQILTPDQLKVYNANCDTIRARMQHKNAFARQAKRMHKADNK